MKGIVWVASLVVFSTAVIFGLGGYFLGRRLPNLSKSIESAYKQEISTWNGKQLRLKGLKKLVNSHIYTG